MNHHGRVAVTTLLIFFVTASLSPQEPASWHDPSSHSIQFITVDKDVKLGVLDWVGSGRSLVLLAGAGETAHVFDDFAQKLTPEYHVYGITRRGFVPSSITAPANGNYSADRLGDDVLAVLDALKLNRPVLVGHSIGGEELSSIGSRNPERVAGLIYLDAGYGYAYYDASQGYFPIDLQNLKEKLDRLGPLNLQGKQDLVQSLLREDLPVIEKGLKQVQTNMYAMPAPAVPARPAIPESDLRLTRELTPDGHFGKSTVDQAVLEALLNQGQKYRGVSVPVLAI
jgi:non-heme chloroperoxidase